MTRLKQLRKEFWWMVFTRIDLPLWRRWKIQPMNSRRHYFKAIVAMNTERNE